MTDTRLHWSKAELRQLLLIIFIFVAACIETDIYLPAFPDMMVYFHVSESEIQKILTWNSMALFFSGLIYGPLSDAIGRKKPLWIALTLFLLGSLATTYAQSFNLLLFGRILQGLGSGGCFTLGSAIIFDAFSQRKALHALNSLNTIIPVVMALAPLIGGFLNAYFGFQANFLAITIVVLLSWIICLSSFEETLSRSNQQSLNFQKLCFDFRRVFSSWPFWQMNLTISLLFGGYLAFLSISSVLFTVEFQVPRMVFPFYQGAVLVGWVAASLAGSRAMEIFGALKTKRIGIILLGISIICFFVSTWFAPRNPFWLTLFMAIYAFGFNWIQTPYFGEIMELMPDIKGLLGSIVSSSRFMLTALVVDISGHFYDKSISSFASLLLGIACFVAVLIWLRESSEGGRSTKVSEPIQAMH